MIIHSCSGDGTALNSSVNGKKVDATERNGKRLTAGSRIECTHGETSLCPERTGAIFGKGRFLAKIRVMGMPGQLCDALARNNTAFTTWLETYRWTSDNGLPVPLHQNPAAADQMRIRTGRPSVAGPFCATNLLFSISSSIRVS